LRHVINFQPHCVKGQQEKEKKKGERFF